MNILTELANIFSDERMSLSAGLLKFKVLASRIDNKDLLEWINLEIKGYNEEYKLPDYRIAEAQLRGKYANSFRSMPEQPIPLFKFPEWLQEFSNTLRITDGVSIVEDIIKNKEDNMIRYSVPAEITATIQKIIREYNPTARYSSLINMNRAISISSYKKIINIVRNHALDMVLELEVAMGHEINIEEIISNRDRANQIVNNYMTHNIITNTGDGNIINVGDKNEISQNSTINKGDFNQLREELSKLGLEIMEINELKETLETDTQNGFSSEIGPKTNSWINKMAEKVKRAGKSVSKEIGISLLSNLLTSYIGF